MNCGKIHIWQTCNSPVIRNNNNIESFYLKHETYKESGLPRFYSNTVNSTFITEGTKTDAFRLVSRDSRIKGEIRTRGTNYEKFVNCDIGGLTSSSTGLGEYINCYIHDTTGNNQGLTNIKMSNIQGIYRNCILENIKKDISFLWLIDNCTINNLTCTTGTNYSGYVITNSKLTNCSIRITDRSSMGKSLKIVKLIILIIY